MKKMHLAPYREYVKGVGSYHQGMNTVNNVAFIMSNGKLKKHGTHYCFGDLQESDDINQWEHILLQINDEQAYGSGLSKDVLHHYYEWLLNYSLFRSAFVSKNISRVMKDRVLVLNPNMDSKLVITAMIAARMAWDKEYDINTRTEIWYEMIEMGVHPSEAFAISRCITRDGDYYKMRGSYGHELFSSQKIAHLNFLEEKLNPEGKSFNEVGGYKTINSFFMAYREKSFDPWEFIKERWVKKDVNTNVFGLKPNLATIPIDKDTFLGVIGEISTDYSSKLKELAINVK